MENINSQIIEALHSGDVAPQVISNYKKELSEFTDNLEQIGYYWAQKIIQLNVNIRTHVDVCILMRDTSSELLWLNTFRTRLIPIIKDYKILHGGI